MLDLLLKAEAELPQLLLEGGWRNVHVIYDKPHVERLWRQWGENRISLHVIHPCDESESFFHPHPWPSAMRVLSGEYAMKVGFGEGLVTPPTASTLVLSPGSVYEMTHKDAWHSVIPKTVCWTVMVSGKPWEREMPQEPKEKQPSLDIDRIYEVLSFFQQKYPLVGG